MIRRTISRLLGKTGNAKGMAQPTAEHHHHPLQPSSNGGRVGSRRCTKRPIGAVRLINRRRNKAASAARRRNRVR